MSERQPNEEHQTNQFDRPIGSDYDPTGDELTPQEATDRIGALYRRAQYQCYPDDQEVNDRNGGRVRALAQALQLLQRAGLEPDDGRVNLLSLIHI